MGGGEGGIHGRDFKMKCKKFWRTRESFYRKYSGVLEVGSVRRVVAARAHQRADAGISRSD